MESCGIVWNRVESCDHLSLASPSTGLEIFLHGDLCDLSCSNGRSSTISSPRTTVDNQAPLQGPVVLERWLTDLRDDRIIRQ